MANFDGLNLRARDLYNREKGRLNFTSGYRDPQYNERVGGAKNSQHIHGNALDISTAGMSDAQVRALVQRLYDEYGVSGVGIYGNSIHVDFGPARAWGSDYSRNTAPQWALDLVAGGGGHPRAGLGDHAGHDHGHAGIEEPPVPLWQMMQRNDEGQFGQTPEGMMRIPGTGLALNQAGLGAALQTFGRSLGGLG